MLFMIMSTYTYHSSECVMQVNGIALVALGSRVSRKPLHDSRCFGKIQGRRVDCHSARVCPSRPGLPSNSSYPTGRETAPDAGHDRHIAQSSKWKRSDGWITAQIVKGTSLHPCTYHVHI